jgi:SAM-dependent methyltransferase
VKDVPADYYRRLHEVDTLHWWHRGMRQIEAALLGERLRRRDQSLLDAGCGTGGFLAWACGLGTFTHLAGVDISVEAVELAHLAAPSADVRVAPLESLPFGDAEFDLALSHDVLQHVPEAGVRTGLRELRRVIRPTGALLVRTNGARRSRRERDDWQAYDAATLAGELERAGFKVERVTYANLVLSLAAAAGGHSPHAPTAERCGIPPVTGGWRAQVGRRLLDAEASYLRGANRRLPWGHTLFAVAVPRRLD